MEKLTVRAFIDYFKDINGKLEEAQKMMTDFDARHFKSIEEIDEFLKQATKEEQDELGTEINRMGDFLFYLSGR